jgi:formate hydrogenlyase subunit 6/NADH:ubiquinone oxidoreductase subunit I
MTKFQLQKFIKWLQGKEYTIIGPAKDGERILIREISDPKELDLSSRLPEYSFKKYLIPSEEVLFGWKNSRVVPKSSRKIAEPVLSEAKRSPHNDRKRQAIIGMSIFDLKALHLYNHVFEKDPYYQARMRNTLIIGQVKMPSPSSQAFQIWQEKYEENILEHLQFDIFLGQYPLTHSSGSLKVYEKTRFRIYTGSEEGQALLEKFGYKNYEHIQFAGPIKEEGIEKRFINIKERLSKIVNSKLWQDLAKKCIECGKCTIVCPTCFCFDINDTSDLKKGNRKRCWSSCLYNEFSQVAGGYKFLGTTRDRIYNWYYHKFVRIMDEYGFPGCVGCGRCAMACPARIEIRKILIDINRY